MTVATVQCSRPLSEHTLPVDGEWVQLDLTDEGFKAFCDLSCLWAWLQHRITEPC